MFSTVTSGLSTESSMFAKFHIPVTPASIMVVATSYAASFGVDEWEYTESETADCAAMAHLFDAVSVREASGVKLCQVYLGVDALHVVDPTMLLNADTYTQLIKTDTPHSSGGLMCYLLDQGSEAKQIVNSIAKAKSLKPFSTNTQTENQQLILEERIQPPVEEWLQGFRDAEFVVTDSFHACIFSILYAKPFVVIGNRSRGMARFESLLQMFGLTDRLVRSYEEYLSRKESLMLHINYEQVSHILEEKRNEAFAFLQKILK